MKNFFWIIFMMALASRLHAGELMHRSLLECERANRSFVWEETQLRPFDELIISWDAKRPLNGIAYLFTQQCIH